MALADQLYSAILTAKAHPLSSEAEPEFPRDGDPGTASVVAGDLGRMVFGLPPAAFGLVEFRTD